MFCGPFSGQCSSCSQPHRVRKFSEHPSQHSMWEKASDLVLELVASPWFGYLCELEPLCKIGLKNLSLFWLWWRLMRCVQVPGSKCFPFLMSQFMYLLRLLPILTFYCYCNGELTLRKSQSF